MQLMLDMAEKTDAVIADIIPQLPEDFPEHISKAIFSGLSKQADKLKDGPLHRLVRTKQESNLLGNVAP